MHFPHCFKSRPTRSVMRVAFGRERRKQMSGRSFCFSKKAKTSKNAVFAGGAPRRTRTLLNGPEGATWNVTSSTFRIIFYHKISYQKSLNPFICQHFSHFISSNNIIQYKHEKIQHKTPRLQKSCIFLAKICNILSYVNLFFKWGYA